MSAHLEAGERSAFAGLPAVVGDGGGVRAGERDGLGIARIAAWRAKRTEAAGILYASFGIEPPNEPRLASRGDVGIAAIAPQIWLATPDTAGNAFAQAVRALLGSCASVTDQSDAYVILRLTGPRVRETLAKLVPIDIHPRSFRVGDVAQTVCGYMSVVLWRLEDTAQGGAAFEIWVGRSLAASLHQAISQGAAEFGFMREAARE